MAAPSVTNTFTNGTTADATQVNTNFTDLINGASDGTKDYTINALTVNGAATFNGACTFGNATGDDITITGSIAATVPWKTNATGDIGSSTKAPPSIYLGNGTQTVRLLAGALTGTYTITFPLATGAIGRSLITSDANSTLVFRFADKVVASQTGAYTATGDETFIPCSASGGAFTVTLPAASGMTGKRYVIKKTDSTTNAVTIDGNASETIDGATTTTLDQQYEAIEILCDASNWHIVQRQIPQGYTTFTLSITAVTANPTKGTGLTDKAYWFRIGKHMKIIYSYKQTGAGTAGTGNYIFNMPSGYTIDTTDLGTANVLGETLLGPADVNLAGTTYQGSVHLYSSSGFFIRVSNETTTFTVSSANGGLDNVVTYSFELMVPLTTWKA